MSKTQTSDEISRFQNWCRLAYCVSKPVKNALLAILHNTISDPSINGLPSDPTQLYEFMVTQENKLRRSKYLSQQQIDQVLLPQSKKVHSASFDISLIRVLLQTYAGITNEDGNWRHPRPSDHSIAAAIYRAARFRSQLFHHDICDSEKKVFERRWLEVERTLDDLHYNKEENIKELRDIKSRLFSQDAEDGLRENNANMVDDFREIQSCFRHVSKQKKDELKNFVKRQFKVSSSNELITDIDTIVESNSSVLVLGKPGLGKTFSAKQLRYLWAAGEIFHQKNLLYIDSKDVEREERDFKSKLAAPICVSQLYHSLRYHSHRYLKSFHCRHLWSMEDLIVVIDGVDELEIGDADINDDFVREIETKVVNDESLSAMETIMAIYLGKFCPGSKVIVFGRENEVNRLIGFHDRLAPSVGSQVVLELQELNENAVERLIHLTTSDETWRATFDLFRDQELGKNPSYLTAMLKMRGYLQNRDIGNITVAKIFMIEILDFFKKCAPTPQQQDVQIFESLLKLNEMQEYCECIQNIAKISFLSLLEEKIMIEVEEWTDDGVGYFKYAPSNNDGDNQAINVKREILEKLNYFYVRQRGSRVLLEPIHTLKIEFLFACYMFPRRREWVSFKKLRDVRQTQIKSFMPSFPKRDPLTKVFVEKVLKPDFEDLSQAYDYFF